MKSNKRSDKQTNKSKHLFLVHLTLFIHLIKHLHRVFSDINFIDRISKAKSGLYIFMLCCLLGNLCQIKHSAFRSLLFRRFCFC